MESYIQLFRIQKELSCGDKSPYERMGMYDEIAVFVNDYVNRMRAGPAAEYRPYV